MFPLRHANGYTFHIVHFLQLTLHFRRNLAAQYGSGVIMDGGIVFFWIFVLTPNRCRYFPGSAKSRAGQTFAGVGEQRAAASRFASYYDCVTIATGDTHAGGTCHRVFRSRTVEPHVRRAKFGKAVGATTALAITTRVCSVRKRPESTVTCSLVSLSVTLRVNEPDTHGLNCIV